jgi:tetratricopeptide (TPR) repeat protein
MTATTPPSPELTAARNRLDRLENFLREDSSNPALLIDAFEAALHCSEFERAEFHLRHGQALSADPWGWRLREGDLLLAQQRHEEARAVLEALAAAAHAPPELGPVVRHNLAFIDFQLGAYIASVARLAPLLETTALASDSPVLQQALQVLWLRSLHRTQELERALLWTRQAEAVNQLSPGAAGVASLIALDANAVDEARRWSQRALSQATPQDQPVEALNTLASLQLGDSDPAQARQLAQAALRFNPRDGRSWSVLAFADMLAGDLDTARTHFDQALTTLPEHVGTWHGLGWTQLLQRHMDEAQATFEHALALDRNFAESHGGLAVVLALKEQNEAAQGHIDRALGLDKHCLSAQYAQAILQGDTQDLAHFQRVVQRLLGGRASGLGGTLLDKVTRNLPPRQ